MEDIQTNVLQDAFGRIAEEVHAVLQDMSEDQLTWRLEETANSIAWLIWHLSRIQDDHISELRVAKQVWTQGWYERFGLPFDVSATGYGQTPDDVAAVRVPADLLAGYFDAVHEATMAFLDHLTPKDLEKIVDRSYNPPVTMSMRLVSVLSDCLQHVGQAAYVKGLFPAPPSMKSHPTALQ